MTGREQSYWRFYWPLSLMGVVSLAGGLAQNYVLLGYESGVRELAVFALALAVVSIFAAGTAFTSQMANVLVRGPLSMRSAVRFMVTLCILFSLPLALMGWTPLGRLVLPLVYNVSEENLTLIVRYLRYLSPLVLVGGASGFQIGLLVQARRTGVVTALAVTQLGLTVGTLAAGVRFRWDPVVALSLSMLVPAAANLVLTTVLQLAYHTHAALGEDRALRQREIAAFFLPLVFTALLFTLSRPIILAFITAQERGDLVGVETTVAAVSLAWSFNVIFQSAANQFRDFFITFGRRDLAGVRRFMARTTVVLTCLMLFVVATPLGTLFLRYLQGATGETLRMAREAMWVLVFVPPIIAWRNYFHGLTLIHRRTGGMTAGSFMRNVAILATAWLLTALGWFNHVAAAGTLVVGFAVEALTVTLVTRGWRRQMATEAAE
jgi:hypothetical protein